MMVKIKLPRHTMILTLSLLFCSTVARAASFVTPSSLLVPTPAPLETADSRVLASRRMILETSTSFERSVTENNILFIRGGGSRFSNSKLHLSHDSFNNAAFSQFNQVMLAANVLGFVVSLLTGGSHLHLDLLGTGAFAIAALPTGLASPIPRVQLSAACVTLWSTKLASFLFFRATKMKHDSRLTDTLSTTSGTFGFWFVSLLWGCLCSLPHSLGATSSYNIPLLQSPCSIAGAALFVVGFLTETTADIQKWLFKQSNPKKFCDVGVWSISQHPNFLGNLLLWSGIFLMNAPALVDPPPAVSAETSITAAFQTLWRYKRVALGALSPLFLYTLFSGQASGTITNAKELSERKYGSDPMFVRYVENVPLIFPNPSKIIAGDKYK